MKQKLFWKLEVLTRFKQPNPEQVELVFYETLNELSLCRWIRLSHLADF